MQTFQEIIQAKLKKESITARKDKPIIPTNVRELYKIIMKEYKYSITEIDKMKLGTFFGLLVVEEEISKHGTA